MSSERGDLPADLTKAKAERAASYICVWIIGVLCGTALAALILLFR